jgi:hypothetical protein
MNVGRRSADAGVWGVYYFMGGKFIGLSCVLWEGGNEDVMIRSRGHKPPRQPVLLR